MTDQDCIQILRDFAKRVRRFGETSDAGMFCGTSGADEPPMKQGELNVQFCVEGSFGLADDLYRAIRHLRKS